MKVAYILNSFPNISETFILNEIRSLIRLGVDCRIFSIGRPVRQPQHPEAQDLLRERVMYCRRPGVWAKTGLFVQRAVHRPARVAAMCRRIATEGRWDWVHTNALWLTRQIDRFAPDHIHAHFADIAGQYALAVHRWSGRPFTVTTHHTDIFIAPPNNYPELAQAASAVICISHYNRNYIARHFGVPLPKLPVVHCGIEPDVFTSRQDQTSGAGASEQPSLLCVARLVAVKGHKFLLQALADLARAGLRCRLLLAGDGPERASLQQQARQLGLAAQVHFLGFLDQRQIRALYHRCDAFVLPSLSEGIPISLMEAMACGKPVIATAVRGVPELVRDRRTGLLCPAGDSRALAQAIRQLVAHPEQIAAMTARGRQLILEQFNLGECTRQLLGLWDAASRLRRESA